MQELLLHPDILHRSVRSDCQHDAVEKLLDVQLSRAVNIEKLEELNNVVRLDEVKQLLLQSIVSIGDLVQSHGATSVLVQLLEQQSDARHYLLYFLFVEGLLCIAVFLPVLDGSLDNDGCDKVHQSDVYNDDEANEVEGQDGISLDHRHIDVSYGVEGHKLHQGQHDPREGREVAVYQQGKLRVFCRHFALRNDLSPEAGKEIKHERQQHHGVDHCAQ
mmetsp:Transcript_62462/g.140841  ORF Transcript_62462/g.140841 Transcript_62462/m.140841 type:complete len:218 (+) Transcript_62462:418-1071(+)